MFYSSVWVVLDTNYSWARSLKQTCPTLASGCGCTAWGCLRLALLSRIFTLPPDLSKIPEDWLLHEILSLEMNGLFQSGHTKIKLLQNQQLFWNIGIYSRCCVEDCQKSCLMVKICEFLEKGKMKIHTSFKMRRPLAFMCTAQLLSFSSTGRLFLSRVLYRLMFRACEWLTQVEVIVESKFPSWWVFQPGEYNPLQQTCFVRKEEWIFIPKYWL